MLFACPTNNHLYVCTFLLVCLVMRLLWLAFLLGLVARFVCLGVLLDILTCTFDSTADDWHLPRKHQSTENIALANLDCCISEWIFKLFNSSCYLYGISFVFCYFWWEFCLIKCNWAFENSWITRLKYEFSGKSTKSSRQWKSWCSRRYWPSPKTIHLLFCIFIICRQLLISLKCEFQVVLMQLCKPLYAEIKLVGAIKHVVC